MLLSMRAHGDKAGYKTYRFANFDGCQEFDGLDFTIKFNRAFDVLRQEMDEDRRTTDQSLHIVDAWLS